MTRPWAVTLCAALLAVLAMPVLAGETRSLEHQQVERLFLLHNAEAKDLGVNLVSLGKERVLSMEASARFNEKLRALGFEVFAPDMSMFTLGGGGVHCLCQALRRDPVD